MAFCKRCGSEVQVGRPPKYEVDRGRVKELRNQGVSWRGVLEEMQLPESAMHSVRRAAK